MLTPWGEQLDASAPLPQYPRPQLVRGDWANLNGVWRYAITPFVDADPLAVPEPTSRPGWDGDIVVPFSPEMPLSGVNRTLGPDEALWYGRRFSLPAELAGRRVLLHFGAVDQTCRVAVDGTEVGGHTGGYLPFSFDITAALADRDEHELVVAVRDVTDTSWLSRGKQATKPGGIWYTAQSGIWQTVWLEVVPEVAVDDLTLLPDLTTGSVVVTVRSDRATPEATARVAVSAEGTQVAIADVPVGAPTPVPIAEPHLWSPEDPFLYDVEVALGEDRVTSYVGLRSFGLGTDDRGHPRLLLNGRPYLPIGLLDQGYWPDGGYTAPSDEALVFDIELARSLGYTMLRKHIKVEPLRWYHHCDRLGMLVWQDAVSGGTGYGRLVTQGPVVGAPQLSDHRYRLFARASAAGRAQYEIELAEMIEHLRSVTSLALWVPFNEGWGQFDAVRIAATVGRVDPSRPVDHASGWHDQGAGDLQSLHIYFRAVKMPRKRDGRVLALTEYGGYSFAVEGHTWGAKAFGYKMLGTREEWQDAVVELHDREIVPAVEAGLGATVYTQLSDVEDEVNGLVTYDRRVVKADAGVFRAMNDRLRAADKGGAVILRELTEPVSLTGPNGRLNPDAVGWARRPVVECSGLVRSPHRTWGRTKRWEYWNVITPSHILALTVSSIDYAAVHEVWVFDRATGEEWGRAATVLPAHGVALPANLGAGVASGRAKELEVEVRPLASGTRLSARIPEASFEVNVACPDDQDCLAVVVPWSDRRFQYTVKDVALPASGRLTIRGRAHEVPDGSWAVLDHGRGRWPYDVHWNWAAASGTSGGHVVGLQLGGKWTEGTGSTENGVFVDGRLHKIHEELSWSYDLADWKRPWRVTGSGLDATLVPFHDKRSASNLGVVSSRTDQCFGTWFGTFTPPDGEAVSFDGLVGWAEDVHNRW